MRTAARCALASSAVALALVLASAAAARTFVYVHDYSKLNQVYGFELTAARGLAPLPGSPFLGPDLPTEIPNRCGGHCGTMAFCRGARVLLTSGPSGVTPWRVSRDGSLVPAPAPFGPGPGLYFGVASATRRMRHFAYVADFATDQVHGYRILPSTELEPLAGFPVGAGPGLLILRAHRGVLAGLNSGPLPPLPPAPASISSWRAGRDGRLTASPGSPWEVASDVSFTLDVDGEGRNVYAGDRDAGEAFFYRIDDHDGSLEPRPVNPVRTALFDTGLGFALARGRIVLAISRMGFAQPFRRRSGELRPLGDPVALGMVPLSHALSGPREFLALATNLELQVFRVRDRGRLEPFASAPLDAFNVNAVLFVEP